MTGPAPERLVVETDQAPESISDRDMFLAGAYTDGIGRMWANDLIRRGYEPVVVMRAAAGTPFTVVARPTRYTRPVTAARVPEEAPDAE